MYLQKKSSTPLMNVKQGIKGVTTKTAAVNNRKAENGIARTKLDMDANRSFLERSTAKIAQQFPEGTEVRDCYSIQLASQVASQGVSGDNTTRSPELISKQVSKRTLNSRVVISNQHKFVKQSGNF